MGQVIVAAPVMKGNYTLSNTGTITISWTFSEEGWALHSARQKQINLIDERR
jgi:hypothetical protein